ncbi:oxidoreductase [Shewanella sp. NFH-SH190041]|uniref:ferredoxin--NADP reductase n=1 Tax=Shewanella sp. NFH-SH190041 TaxID=2950245 RepID=UPI0021C25AF3|nr:ferredoxin--NADP reductase [Shewanella sp. NFH-SH190041]BDM64216.1 oxidoreductase [Shewanella sp. NFH-SH190041]
MSSRYHALVVSQVIPETHDATSLVLTVPPELAERYQYKSGQFLTFKLPGQDGELLRCYSMSSSPALEQGLRVTIKRVAGGRASNYLCDHIGPGDRLQVMQPAGLFVVRDSSEHLLLCAGGSGITPVFSILQTVLHTGTGKIRLLYANRDESSVIFAAELKALVQAFPERLEVIHLLDSLSGVPSAALLSSLSDWQQQRAYICGPGAFMDAMETVLYQLGMDKSHIYIERFISPAAPTAKNSIDACDIESRADPAVAPASELAPDKQVNTEITQAIAEVELDGTVHHIVWRGDETLLDAAEKAGVELPYSCRSGMCASCMCEVTEGQVALQYNDVLDERDLQQNLTLSCQALPRTEKVKLRYT